MWHLIDAKFTLDSIGCVSMERKALNDSVSRQYNCSDKEIREAVDDA